MSENGKKKQPNKAETQEKVMTRYDLKMQRRQEQKKKEERDRKIATAVGILILVGLICLVASFPIRAWRTVHGTYIVVDGEKVTKVEFDYNYNTVRDQYIAQNGYMLSYFGLDLTGDLSTVMYSDTLTFQDFFEQMAVDSLISNKTMKRDMEASGFVYDETQDYEKFVDALKQAADEEGITFKAYLRERYGSYATLGRMEGYIRETLKLSAYLEEVRKQKAPSDSEIQAYYEENKDNFDSVAYHMITVNAQLPTEPTELADPVEEADNEAEGTEETVYQPSQAEIDAAMAIAKAEAEGFLDTVASEGEVYTDRPLSSLIYSNDELADWLFESGRKKGDTTVIEDTLYNCYYVVSFDERYLNESPSVNMRAVVTQDGNGQAILDEWAAGAATEDSFAELADRYNGFTTSSQKGGLIEGIVSENLQTELSDWLFDPARSYGDTAVITPEGGTVTYVFYYVGTGDPDWKLNIKNILTENAMSEYLEGLTANSVVEDPHGNLNFLKVQAQEEAAAAGGDGTEDSETDGSSAE